MHLELMKQGELAPEYARLLDAIAQKIRREFVTCLDRLGEGRESDIDWWVSELASRNTYTSDLFIHCCYALLAKELLDRGEQLTSVVVDSKALQRVLQRHFLATGKRIPVRLAGSRRFPRLPLHYLRYLYEFILARFIFPMNRGRLKVPITLIDTFITEETFVRNKYCDRYYAEFGGFLPREDCQALVWFPTFLNRVKSAHLILRAIRQSEHLFILKEDYLRLRDYAFAFLYPFRALKLYPGKYTLQGIDITALLRHVWLSNLTSASSLEGLLKYRCIHRMKSEGVAIRLVIDWFENQSIDKGANAGFRRWYPTTPVIGHQGYIIPRHYLAMYPTEQEYESKVIPTSVAVPGEGFINDRREFCQKLHVVVHPALRFGRVWNVRHTWPDPRCFAILVTLHLTECNSLEVLKRLDFLRNVSLPEDTRFWIKPHPLGASVKELLARASLELPKYTTIVRGDFGELIEQADVLMGNTSSTCLEALARGVPVIIVGSLSGLTQNPIPDDVPCDMWRVCYRAEEFGEALRHFRSRKNENRAVFELAAKAIRAKYFEPVSKKAVREMLCLP